MAQLGTADVTYTVIEGTHQASPSVPQKERQFLMLLPNATNVLYTNGGIPISIGQLGCPNYLTKFLIEDMASSVGYVAKWDQKANTIRLYQQGNITIGATGSTIPAQTLVEMATSATVVSTTLRVLAGGW